MAYIGGCITLHVFTYSFFLFRCRYDKWNFCAWFAIILPILKEFVLFVDVGTVFRDVGKIIRYHHLTHILYPMIRERKNQL